MDVNLSNISEAGEDMITSFVAENTALADLSNINSTAKTIICNLNSPDWSRLIDLGNLEQYTFEENGYLILFGIGVTVNSYIGYKSSLDTTDNVYTYVLSIPNTLSTINHYRVRCGETITRIVRNGSMGTYFLPLNNNI